MRWIKKKKSPDPFERWKAQAKPQSWNQLPGTLPDARSPHYHYYSKDELRAVLLKEQNSKCLYCESCISNHPSKTRVDHVKTPQALAQTSEQIFDRSEEHTSELQSRGHLVCRLLLEKKNRT